jgi:hypothetical protein
MPPKTKEEKQLVTQTPSAIVQYGDWSEDQMKQDDKEMSSGGDFWKVPTGRTVVRFLPPKLGWPSPFVIQHQHFIRMPGVEKAIVFACPKEHESKKCLACDKADTLETSGNARDSKQSKGLRPQRRVMANVIITPKDAESSVMIWAFGKRVYDALKAIRTDDENGGNFLDPVKGFNISVLRAGQGKDDTVYTLTPGREQTQILNMDWIEIQGDLRKLIRIPTVDQQKRLFEGEDPRDVWGDKGGGGDEDEHPRQKKAGKSDVIDVDPDTRTAEDDLFDDEVDLD